MRRPQRIAVDGDGRDRFQRCVVEIGDQVAAGEFTLQLLPEIGLQAGLHRVEIRVADEASGILVLIIEEQAVGGFQEGDEGRRQLIAETAANLGLVVVAGGLIHQQAIRENGIAIGLPGEVEAGCGAQDAEIPRHVGARGIFVDLRLRHGIGDRIGIADFLAAQIVAGAQRGDRFVGQLEPELGLDPGLRIVLPRARQRLVPGALGIDAQLMQRPVR